MGTCTERGQRGRCRRPTINPKAQCWRLVALHRSIEPLLRFCGYHAERRISLALGPRKEGMAGRRRELYDVLNRARAGDWVTYESLALALYGDSGPSEISAVRMLVWRIRQHDEGLIETLRGVGYRLAVGRTEMAITA